MKLMVCLPLHINLRAISDRPVRKNKDNVLVSNRIRLEKPKSAEPIRANLNVVRAMCLIQSLRARQVVPTAITAIYVD